MPFKSKKENTPDFNVIGIGTSAGGLESMSRLLPNLKPGSSNVYIIAQHMAKGNHLEVVIRLLNQLSLLPVAEAKNNDKLVPEHIYVLPPGYSGVVSDSRIFLLPISTEQISTPSINALFNSIAQTYGGNGIGIILSGTGSDGLNGCRSIKAQGGKILVQTLDSSTFDGMPSSVIEAGLAEHILSPEEIGQLLSNPIADLKPEIASEALEHCESTDESRLTILKFLVQEVFKASGNDFSDYKEDTLLRRLERRVAMLKIDSFEQYINHVRQHPEELLILRNQFLISFSSFFRDFGAFAALKKQMTRRIELKQQGEMVRIWVPGCASGEEVFSLAIMLAEIMGDRVRDEVVIIGTDLNSEAIARAQKGLYKASAFKEIDPKLRALYFTPYGEYWQVGDNLRSLCQFECCDILKHTTLSGLDLISCRNLLIYMKPSTQDQLLYKFHDCLLQDGLLFLGQSESPKLLGLTLFKPIDEDARLFEKF